MRGFALASVGILAGLADAEATEPLVDRASVIDGDTIEIHGERDRLHGIDAPESWQRCVDNAGGEYLCGKAAAEALDAFLAASSPTTCRRTKAALRNGVGPENGRKPARHRMSASGPLRAFSQVCEDRGLGASQVESDAAPATLRDPCDIGGSTWRCDRRPHAGTGRQTRSMS